MPNDDELWCVEVVYSIQPGQILASYAQIDAHEFCYDTYAQVVQKLNIGRPFVNFEIGAVPDTKAEDNLAELILPVEAIRAVHLRPFDVEEVKKVDKGQKPPAQQDSEIPVEFQQLSFEGSSGITGTGGTNVHPEAP